MKHKVTKPGQMMFRGETPDLPVPAYQSGMMECVDVPGKGKGWRATQSIAAGTSLLVSKPIAVVMDCEVAQYDSENPDTAMLIIRTAQRLGQDPSLWDELSQLWPRQADMAGEDAPEKWVCDEPSLCKQVDAALGELPFLQGQPEEQERLKLIVRSVSSPCSC